MIIQAKPPKTLKIRQIPTFYPEGGRHMRKAENIPDFKKKLPINRIIRSKAAQFPAFLCVFSTVLKIISALALIDLVFF